MATLTIHDEALVEQLKQVAVQENRPIEEVLRQMLAAHHSVQSQPIADPDAGVREVRRKAYTKARHYWQETGNAERLALTDEELDEQFWVFDGEGIPRLKSDEGRFEFEESSLMRFAKFAEEANIEFYDSEMNEIEDFDAFLKAKFATHLLHEMDDE